MTEIIKETITTKENQSNPVVTTPVENDGDSGNPILTTQVKTGASNRETIEYGIYFLFGFLEVLLAFRLLLKLTGASLSSAFVRFIYGVTGIFILPFEGIFRKGYAQGAETTSVLEPSTLVAIIVYIILAWGIVKLLHISSGEKQSS
ncbi:MAG: hypothetical protein US68_C0012G0021 [Candidatus Shapirobacteria bacterium GW2011_GWE1_38_10]|uniref:YGGT family protein n=1 Tax=Candidatus Shapirobacteria bacterium GW2011_GWE1_38_10 TaxID=1618488 RepID=A0A0G0LAH3_9BACT|nr:MAG: hypothetical protein US46_C0011G0027 [Candidatus Shapirobacteria bacterium GW2011_GWF2_37_20]KKQ49626.1 MAG: hypothetical protein US68_C0012G0021 [Candidatus Shapirobacteria bacterium GW2011_GWE1_38_10]KKQ64604.1 MAG: hypothetical protein US85_C0006G0011 [Candidatus Shapirobacteria bacterium GW2011_GWF1_38_23]